MKRLLNLLLVLTLTFGCLYAFAACSNNKNTSDVVSGAVYQIKKDFDGKEYAVLTKYRLNDEDAEKVANGEFDKIENVETLRNPVINVYETKNDKGDTVTYEVREVAESAFSGQAILKTVTFGENVKKLGAACLAGCSNLEKITATFVGEAAEAFNEKKTMGYLFGTSEADGTTSTTVKYNGASGSNTYYVPASLKEIEIKNAADYVIPDYAFYGMPCETVTIANLTAIGEGTFGGMTSLAKYKVPATVKSIGNSAFEGCTALLKVDFSAATQLTSIGKKAFAGCTKLGKANYANEGIVTIPDSVTFVGERVFEGCTSLKKVVFGAGVTKIEEATFSDCTALETVEFKSNATILLGVMSFHNCEKLNSLTSANGGTLDSFKAGSPSAFDNI